MANMTFKANLNPQTDYGYELGSSSDEKRWKLNGLAGGPIEYIVGQQTAATGSWIGTTKDKTLITGKVIAYKLPYAGSGNASLTLTYTNPDEGADTNSGAIPVYLNNTRATTHYVANSVIIMVYDGTNWRSTDYWNSNSRDAGYGKISLTQSDATSAITTNTTQLVAATYNEAMTLKAGNKWVQFAGTNGTSGNDVLTVAHSLSGATAGSYGDSSAQTPGYGQTFKVPYLTVDAGGHITAVSEHTVAIPPSDEQNTTYTFASGTTGNFTVTPSDGEAQTISIGKPATAGAADSATKDGSGNTISSTYLKLSGGTMTGVLTVKGSMYTDAYDGALNMNNSDIYGLNSIYTADTADTAAEGIHFYRDTTHVDTLWMSGGDLLFVPNRALGTSTSKANSQKVARFTANPTTGQVVVTDGTTGGVKTTGYTIATSVPSNAVFTDTDTKQNITLATTSKAFITGVTTTPTSSAQALTGVADTGVYLTETAGELSAVRHSFNSSGTEKAYLTFNTTTNALDFIFT